MRAYPRAASGASISGASGRGFLAALAALRYGRGHRCARSRSKDAAGDSLPPVRAGDQVAWRRAPYRQAHRSTGGAACRRPVVASAERPDRPTFLAEDRRRSGGRDRHADAAHRATRPGANPAHALQGSVPRRHRHTVAGLLPRQRRLPQQDPARGGGACGQRQDRAVRRSVADQPPRPHRHVGRACGFTVGRTRLSVDRWAPCQVAWPCHPRRPRWYAVAAGVAGPRFSRTPGLAKLGRVAARGAYAGGPR